MLAQMTLYKMLHSWGGRSPFSFCFLPVSPRDPIFPSSGDRSWGDTSHASHTLKSLCVSQLTTQAFGPAHYPLNLWFTRIYIDTHTYIHLKTWTVSLGGLGLDKDTCSADGLRCVQADNTFRPGDLQCCFWDWGLGGEKQDWNCVAQNIPKLMAYPVSASQMLAVQVST